MSTTFHSEQQLQISHHLIINANDEFKEHHGQQHQDNNNHRQTHTEHSLRPAPIAITKQQQMTDIIQTKDAEFDKIFPILHNDAIPLQQHKQRIKEECVNFDCKDYKFCPCVRRLIIILCSYQSYICSLYWMKQPVSHFVTYKIYEYEAILADFQHIQRFHSDNNSPQNNVFPYVENMILRKCGIGRVCGHDQCPAFQRHHRDKSKTVENLLLYYKSNTDECSTEKELELELDRIHVYFLHGVLKYANPICSDDVLSADEYKDAFNVHSDEEVLQLQNEWELRLKSYAIMTRIRSKHIATYNVANIENDKIEDDIKTFRGKDRLSMQCIVRDSKTCNELYVKLEKKMGQFVWQRIKSVEGVKNLYNVTARYDNIKDEVLHCPFKVITIYDWNDTLRKSKKIKRSWIGQSIRTHNEEKHGYASDFEQIRHAKWEKNEAISLKEIIAIKLYTDFDKLQHELKKCFRIITNYVYQYDDDTLLAMRRRLSSYSNWRQCLTVTIKKFSVSIGYKRFYHGVNPLMIIQRHNILSRLWGPLSATASYHVASTFATDKGMVIEMNSQYPQLPLCYAFDASQLSDYPEESERLVGFMYVRVRKIFSKTPIIMPDSDINAVFEKQNAHLIRLYFFAMRLFLEGIYSMDRFLEKVYVELLTLAIEYREDEMENDLNKVENALKSTKENRKYGIKCKEMFLLKMSEIMLKPSHHFHVILDDISPGLRSLMLRNDKEKDIMSGGDIWNVDFFKIDRIYPNMKGLSLFNKYRFNNYNIKRFLVWLNETRNKEFVLLKFVYFDYYSSSSENQINKRKQSKNKRTEKMFVKLQDLDLKLKEELKMKGWQLKDKELNGYGYRINLTK